jgi:hypothetical protein
MHAGIMKCSVEGILVKESDLHLQLEIAESVTSGIAPVHAKSHPAWPKTSAKTDAMTVAMTDAMTDAMTREILATISIP